MSVSAQRQSFTSLIRQIFIALAIISAGVMQISTGAQATPPQTSAVPKTSASPQTATPSANAAQLVAQMPGAEPSKPYHFPPVATKTLANGLRVFVVTSAAQPAIGVQLLMTSAGSVNDPAGKAGVSAMTASLLTQGTDKRTAQQIAESIDFVGGSLGATASHDGTIVSTNVVKKDFALAMDLLSDVTLHAKFADEEIARQKQQLLSNLRVNYDDADYLASAVYSRTCERRLVSYSTSTGTSWKNN